MCRASAKSRCLGGQQEHADLRMEACASADYNLFERNKSKNKGLISADRRTKPTLMLTVPQSYKVVYNGFISSNVENCDKIRC